MANSSEFRGFYPETKAFFEELAVNNNKEWFDTHRKDYDKFVKEPSKAFVRAVMLRFAERGIPFMGDPSKSLFRINRDIRFSANKDPYKTNLGAYFVYTKAGEFKRSPEVPGMYFHFQPGMVFIGGGLHQPMPEDLKKIRERISEDYEELNQIITDPLFRYHFDTILAGEKLKKMPKGYANDHPAGELLKLKEFSAMSNISDETAFTYKIVELFEEKCLSIIPLIEYLTIAIQEG